MTRDPHRKCSAQQKLEVVLAGLRGDRSVKEVCRHHEIAETLYYSWRDQLLEGGREQLAGKDERQGEKELRRRARELQDGAVLPMVQHGVSGTAARANRRAAQACSAISVSPTPTPTEEVALASSTRLRPPPLAA